MHAVCRIQGRLPIECIHHNTQADACKELSYPVCFLRGIRGVSAAFWACSSVCRELFVKFVRSSKNEFFRTSFGEKSKSRAFVGTMAQIFMLAWEFIRKFMYVILLIYVPYTILAYFFPLIRIHQDISIIYLFIMLSTICGSLANTTIFAMGDRDYLMIRVMLVSPYMNFLGKFIYKIVTEFVFYFIILIILGEPVFNALMLCIVTACARPVGEMMAIITFDHFRGVYENRSVLNGTIMAICVILAYGLPVLNGRIAASWIYAIHPFVVCVMFLVGAGAMYFLWWYKYYRVIIREAMHNKREF